MALGLDCIAGRSRSVEQPVNQHPSTVAGVPVHHDAVGLLLHSRNRLPCIGSFKPRVTAAEDDPLQPAIPADEHDGLIDKRLIIAAGDRVEKVHACHVAFTATGGFEPGRRAHGEEPDRQAAPVEPSPQPVEPGAMSLPANDTPWRGTMLRRISTPPALLSVGSIITTA